MKEEQKGNLFRELIGYEAFQAQKLLEDEFATSFMSKMLAIDTTQPNVAVEYARLRGSLDALKMLKASREHLIEKSRSRTPNS